MENVFQDNLAAKGGKNVIQQFLLGKIKTQLYILKWLLLLVNLVQ
jgi:hypothetical protein